MESHDIWQFTALECHAFLDGLKHLMPFLDQDERMLRWRLSFESSGFLQVTPLEPDRAMIELLVAAEISRMWNLDNETKLPCGHTADDHLRILNGWRQRELLTPKRLASAREALKR